MGTRLTLILYIFCTFIFTCVHSQEYAHFDHYTAKDGLLSNKIIDLAQDSAGFLWIATDFGIDRFDGTLFRHWQAKEYPSMIRNDIYCIAPIKDGLTLGGRNGLLLEYDYKRDLFFDKKPADFDTSYYRETIGFFFPAKGKKYAYTIGGIYRYDEKEHEFKRDFKAFDSINYKYVKCMYVDKFNHFWIGSVDCLMVFDQEGKLLKKFDATFGPCGYITEILPIEKENKLVISSITSNLWIFDISSPQVKNPEIIHLPFDNIRHLIRDSKQRYWFATDGYGLWYTDSELDGNANFKSLQPYGTNNEEIKKIYAITEDHDGDIWIGTQNSGLWRYKRDQLNGIAFSSDFGFPNAVCSGFMEDPSGNIIVSSDGKGLFSTSPNFKIIKNIEISNHNVLSMDIDKNGEIWLSTWGGGVYLYDPQTQKLGNIDFSGISAPNKCVFSTEVMPDGEVFVCTAGGGLYIRDKEKKWHRKALKAEDYPVEDIWVFRSEKGRNNVKWVMTTNTLWRIENGECRPILPNVTNLKSLNPLSICDAVCDDDGNLFASTNKGIMRFVADGSSYETLNFLPSGEYKSILRYKDGTYWTTGYNGIISFDYKKKEYKKLPGNFRDMTKSNFYPHSIYADSKGKIYAGTNGGFFLFDPQNILTDSIIPYFSFSDLYISNQRIRPYEDNILKKGCLSEVKEITFSHNQASYITIQMDIIDFSGYNKTICKYKLKGMDNDWIEMENNRSITFSYLPSGQYTLEVIAYKENIPDSERMISMTITVLPPWWATWWFRSIVLLIVASSVTLYFLTRLHRLERKRAILQEKVEERTSELKQALCDKDRLISVIAHDLKNPMFAIVGALESWISKEQEMDNDKKSKSVKEIFNAAQILQNEMLKLLDWARSKKDDIVCHPTDTNVKFAVNNILILLRGMINDKHLEVTLDFGITNYAYIDSRMLSTVIRNLISNAIKFTKDNGNILITAKQDEKTMRLSISDSGIGMNAQQIDEINAGECRSTLGTSNEKGTGLGFKICQDYMARNNGQIEIRSEVGKGSCITLTIPLSSKVIDDKTEQKAANISFEVNKDLLEGNTILIIDDDPLICNNLKGILESYTNVLTANNGKDALVLAEKHIPDVILSDVEMPLMNGIEMSVELGKSDKTKHIPILFISAKNEDSDRLLGLLSGAIDYISKPFSQTELLIKLSNILNIRQKQQQKILSESLHKVNNEKEDAASVPEADKQQMNPFLKDLLNVLSKRYTNSQLSIEDVANDMCVSQSTLNRKVRSITGKTPLEVLNEYRLNKALQLLKSTQTNVSVGDIAYMVGYNDPAYFTKKFREYFGYTPSKA